MQTLGERVEQVAAETEKNRYVYIRTDLEACFTVADIVNTESTYGDRKRARQALAIAQDGLDTAQRFLRDLKDEELRKELEAKAAALSERLNSLERTHNLP